MFDSYTLAPRNSFTDVRANVQIHRAPTDKSVELLSEFEQKARDRVIGAFDVKFNELNTKWWIERTCDKFDDKAKLRVLVDLNGQRYDFTLTEICVHDIQFQTPKVIVANWKQELAKQLAEEMMLRAAIEDKQFNRDIERLFKRNRL